MRLTRPLRRLHLALALTLGAWFVLAGLTGAVLVFWKQLEPVPVVAGDAPALPHGELARRGAAVAGKDAYPWRYVPAEPGRPAELVVLPPTGGRLTLYLHPATGEALSRIAWRDAWIHWLYDFHASLLAGRTGTVVVGLAGLGLALQAGLGLALWSRRHGAPLAESLRPMPGLRGLRRQRNWHRALGAWTAVPLVLAAITGSGLAFPETVRDLFTPLLPQSRFVDDVPKPRPLTLDDALAQAEAAFPAYRLNWLNLPEAKGQPWEIFLKPRDRAVSGNVLYVVRPDGRLLLGEYPRPVETLRAWIMALHNGSAGGIMHRLGVVLLGLAPLASAVTGWAMWRRRTPPSARAREHQHAVAVVRELP